MKYKPGQPFVMETKCGIVRGAIQDVYEVDWFLPTDNPQAFDFEGPGYCTEEEMERYLKGFDFRQLVLFVAYASTNNFIAY